MYRKKRKFIFIILSLSLLASCGEGLVVKNQDIIASSPLSACPETEDDASSSEFASSSDIASSSKFASSSEFVSSKIQITSVQLQNQNEDIQLSLNIDKQCANFLKFSQLSQKIINTSSTVDIPILNQQNYAFSIKKSKFIDFQKQVEEDYCIKIVNLERNFKLIQPVKFTGAEHLLKLQQDASTIKLNSKIAKSPEGFNDPFLIRQSHLWAISFFDAFKKFYHSEYGLNDSSDNPSIVAIVDSPANENHEDLNGMFINANIAHIDGTQDKYHATHIAGLIAATHNELGTVGIASKSVKLISIGVTSTVNTTTNRVTTGNLENQLNAIANLSSNLKPVVVNLSLQLKTDTTCNEAKHKSTSEAIKKLLDQGISIVVAAGNDGKELKLNESLPYPACLSQTSGFAGLITVGSVNVDNDTTIEGKSSFSNYSNEYVHIAAPGSSPLGGLYSTSDNDSNDKYTWEAGTSMSAPLVTAAVALSYSVLNKKREEIENQNIFEKCGISSEDKPKIIKNLILESAVKDDRFTDFWEEGNVLNFSNLIEKIQFIYPDTLKN